MSWTIIGFVWNLSRPMAPGAALSAIPRMSRDSPRPGFHDPRRFTFEPTHVDFSLTNESDSDFGIIWDEAVFVDGVSNAAEGVFHRGVKLLDRHDAQVPSVVVKGSCVSESLAVKNRVFYSRDLKRWVFENLLRDADKLTQIKILLPIETAGGRRDYLFVFSVHWENRKVRAEFDTGRWFYVSEK